MFLLEYSQPYLYPHQVSRVELLDEVQIRAINMANGKNLTEVPTLMFEFIGTGDDASYFLYFPSGISR